MSLDREWAMSKTEGSASAAKRFYEGLDVSLRLYEETVELFNLLAEEEPIESCRTIPADPYSDPEAVRTIRSAA